MAETLIINGAEITTEHSMVADEKVFSDEVSVVKANGGYEIKRAIKNLSDKPAKLKELAFLCKGFSFGKDAEANAAKAAEAAEIQVKGDTGNEQQS